MRSWLLWIVPVLFAATFLFAWHTFGPSQSNQRLPLKENRVEEIADCLRAQGDELRVIAASDSSKILADGFYVTTRKDVTFAKANALLCNPRFLDDWKGVARVRKDKNDAAAVAEERKAWGNNGVFADGIMIVGDREVIERILASLRHCAEKER